MLALKIPQQKTVHFGSYSRMLATDPDLYHYVNKPFEFRRNGPAIAILGAGMTISAGITMGGIMGGLMIAGGIASGLGALTGNKFLSTLGMGLSLVGGIGSAFSAVDAAGNTSFVNPFTEGFGNTSAGKLLNKFTGAFGGDAATPAGDYTAGLVEAAKGNMAAGTNLPGGGINLTGGASELSNPIVATAQDLGGGGFSSAYDLASQTGAAGGTGINLAAGAIQPAAPGVNLGGVASAASPAQAASGFGGVWDKLNNSSGLLNFASGVSDNIQAQPFIDAKIENMEAHTNQIDFATQNAKDKVNNLQFQDVGNLPTGSGAAQQQVTPTRPGVGTHVVALPNGQVVTLDDTQFAIYQQQSQQGPQVSGAGLLRQGVPA